MTKIISDDPKTSALLETVNVRVVELEMTNGEVFHALIWYMLLMTIPQDPEHLWDVSKSCRDLEVVMGGSLAALEKEFSN